MLTAVDITLVITIIVIGVATRVIGSKLYII